MSNELIHIRNENIKDLIYTIRGKQVMLDSDVALFYKCETKIINQTRKRNLKRFPEDFFQLMKQEYNSFKVTICHLKRIRKRTTQKVFAICI